MSGNGTGSEAGVAQEAQNPLASLLGDDEPLIEEVIRDALRAAVATFEPVPLRPPDARGTSGSHGEPWHCVPILPELQYSALLRELVGGRCAHEDTVQQPRSFDHAHAVTSLRQLISGARKLNTLLRQQREELKLAVEARREDVTGEPRRRSREGAGGSISDGLLRGAVRAVARSGVPRIVDDADACVAESWLLHRGLGSHGTAHESTAPGVAAAPQRQPTEALARLYDRGTQAPATEAGDIDSLDGDSLQHVAHLRRRPPPPPHSLRRPASLPTAPAAHREPVAPPPRAEVVMSPAARPSTYRAPPSTQRAGASSIRKVVAASHPGSPTAPSRCSPPRCPLFSPSSMSDMRRSARQPRSAMFCFLPSTAPRSLLGSFTSIAASPVEFITSLLTSAPSGSRAPRDMSDGGKQASPVCSPAAGPRFDKTFNVTSSPTHSLRRLQYVAGWVVCANRTFSVTASASDSCVPQGCTATALGVFGQCDAEVICGGGRSGAVPGALLSYDSVKGLTVGLAPPFREALEEDRRRGATEPTPRGLRSSLTAKPTVDSCAFNEFSHALGEEIEMTETPVSRLAPTASAPSGVTGAACPAESFLRWPDRCVTLDLECDVELRRMEAALAPSMPRTPTGEDVGQQQHQPLPSSRLATWTRSFVIQFDTQDAMNGFLAAFLYWRPQLRAEPAPITYATHSPQPGTRAQPTGSASRGTALPQNGGPSSSQFAGNTCDTLTAFEASVPIPWAPRKNSSDGVRVTLDESERGLCDRLALCPSYYARLKSFTQAKRGVPRALSLMDLAITVRPVIADGIVVDADGSPDAFSAMPCDVSRLLEVLLFFESRGWVRLHSLYRVPHDRAAWASDSPQAPESPGGRAAGAAPQPLPLEFDRDNNVNEAGHLVTAAFHQRSFQAW